MFIGHYAVAFLLVVLFPQVPVLVPFFAVGFPDLLWAVLVLARVEKVEVNPDSPLQKYMRFAKYPYSHSLVVTNVLSLTVGAVLAAALGNPYVALVFVLGSASHWLLDVVVHLGDLPVLGFNGDRKVGFGLWKWGKTAFAFEFLFYAAAAVVLLPTSFVPGALVLGAVFHAVNANTFLGLTKKNPFDSSSSAYAAVTLVGFTLIPLFAGGVI